MRGVGSMAAAVAENWKLDGKIGWGGFVPLSRGGEGEKKWDRNIISCERRKEGPPMNLPIKEKKRGWIWLEETSLYPIFFFLSGRRRKETTFPWKTESYWLFSSSFRGFAKPISSPSSSPFRGPFSSLPPLRSIKTGNGNRANSGQINAIIEKWSLTERKGGKRKQVLSVDLKAHTKWENNRKLSNLVLSATCLTWACYIFKNYISH